MANLLLQLLKLRAYKRLNNGHCLGHTLPETHAIQVGIDKVCVILDKAQTHVEPGECGLKIRMQADIFSRLVQEASNSIQFVKVCKSIR
jgi:hypothetical protein